MTRPRAPRAANTAPRQPDGPSELRTQCEALLTELESYTTLFTDVPDEEKRARDIRVRDLAKTVYVNARKLLPTLDLQPLARLLDPYQDLST